MSIADRESQIKIELLKTIGHKNYNGWVNKKTKYAEYGYQSFNLDGINIPGHRKPEDRLNTFRKFVNFSNAKVIDFGCSVGGMLFHLDEIEKGIGFDYDPTCIEAAQNIKHILSRGDDLNFHVHDFDKDGYEDLKNKISFTPDICFILSIGAWVKTLGTLLDLCVDYRSKIIVEVNNGKDGLQQIKNLKNKGMKIDIIQKGSPDDINPKNRKKRATYLVH